MRGICTISFLALFLAAGSVQAQGVLFVEQETRGANTYTHQIQMDKTHMRAETHSSGDNGVFIFDGDAKVARSVDLNKKTYIEIDGAMSQKMRQQMAEMEEQMKKMSPQERAMMEGMMRGRGPFPGAAGQTRVQYKQTGSDKVGQWACTKYEGYRGQDKTTEICAVDPKEFGLTAEDFEVTRQLAEFLRTIFPQIADQVMVYGSGEQGYAGVPIRRITYAAGKVVSTAEIKEFRRESFPASTWQIPAGLKKENPMGR